MTPTKRTLLLLSWLLSHNEPFIIVYQHGNETRLTRYYLALLANGHRAVDLLDLETLDSFLRLWDGIREENQ